MQFYDTIIEFAYAADAMLKEDPTRAPSSIRGTALYEALTKTRTVGMQGRVVIDDYGLKEGHFVIRNVWGTSLPLARLPLPIRGFCRAWTGINRGALVAHCTWGRTSAEAQRFALGALTDGPRPCREAECAGDAARHLRQVGDAHRQPWRVGDRPERQHHVGVPGQARALHG